MSEIEQTSDREIVRVKAEPVPAEPRSREVRVVRWLGAALAFAGREIVPRLAALLLDAWDRRASRSAPSSSDLASERPAPPSVADLPREGGQQHRQRRRGK
jgi:hypothetical protein